MKKKIIFFDGDGTLWYPKATKRTEKPHWVYHDPLTKDNYLAHLELTPRAKETLTLLHGRGVCLVVISANPYAEEVAVKEIKERLAYFGLTDLFYACRASSGSDPQGKPAIMLEIIKELGLSKKDALMVGDSYFYDYLAAKDAGIDAFFVENEVSKMPDQMPTTIQSIHEVSDLADIVTLS
jgi:phosphoglycolate phosphatase-like HAD superfamily hydrolase